MHTRIRTLGLETDGKACEDARDAEDTAVRRTAALQEGHVIDRLPGNARVTAPS